MSGLVAVGGLRSGFDGIDYLDGPMVEGIVRHDSGLFITWEDV